MKKDRVIYIYGLKEKRAVEIKYIGQTVHLKSRHRSHVEHLSEAMESNPKRLWIEDALRRGEKIDMVVLEECTSAGIAVKRENFWIDFYRSVGCNLTNTRIATRSQIGTCRPSREIQYPWNNSDWLKTLPDLSTLRLMTPEESRLEGMDAKAAYWDFK